MDAHGRGLPGKGVAQAERDKRTDPQLDPVHTARATAPGMGRRSVRDSVKQQRRSVLTRDVEPLRPLTYEENVGDALKIRGFLPLNDILYNQQEQRLYKVELELNIKELKVTGLFDFNIAYIKNSRSNFHDVIARGTLNLSDFKVQDTNGFEPDITIIMKFQMLNLQR